MEITQEENSDPPPRGHHFVIQASPDPTAKARERRRAARAGTLRMLRRTCPATNTGRTSYANPTRRPEPLPPVSDMHALPTCLWRTGHLTATLPTLLITERVYGPFGPPPRGVFGIRAWRPGPPPRQMAPGAYPLSTLLDLNESQGQRRVASLGGHGPGVRDIKVDQQRAGSTAEIAVSFTARSETERAEDRYACSSIDAHRRKPSCRPGKPRYYAHGRWQR